MLKPGKSLGVYTLTALENMVENWRMLENHFVHARIVNRRKILKKCGTCQNKHIGTKNLHETFGLKSRNIC